MKIVGRVIGREKGDVRRVHHAVEGRPLHARFCRKLIVKAPELVAIALVMLEEFQVVIGEPIERLPLLARRFGRDAVLARRIELR